MATPRRAPMLSLLIEYEQAPRLHVSARTDRDATRLWDWVLSHPTWVEALRQLIGEDDAEATT
jgi:hypothetical protein